MLAVNILQIPCNWLAIDFVLWLNNDFVVEEKHHALKIVHALHFEWYIISQKHYDDTFFSGISAVQN